jgi:hypothetical protein
MRTFPVPAAFAALVLVVAAPLAAQCPPQGLLLTVDGRRLGDPFAIGVYGTPFVSGLLGIDVAAGPTQTPIGPICLGFTPSLQLLPFSLDAAGALSITGILPANPVLTGFTPALQAAAADTSVPGGLALSNGESPTLRAPRMFFFNPGLASPFGSTPGSFCAYDALSDVPASAAVPLPAPVADAVVVPAANLLAILLNNATLFVVNADTGVPVLNMSLPLTPGYPTKLGVEGSTLFVLYYGTAPNPFTPGTPGAVRTYSMPSGTPGLTVQLPSGNPDDFMMLPGTGLAYLRVGPDVVPVDLVAGVPLPPISVAAGTAGISEWALHNGYIYCLMAGQAPNPFGGGGIPPAINAVDTTTNTALHPAPIQFGVSPPATTLRYGPGTGGVPAVFAFFPTLSTVSELSPLTFMPVSGISVGAGLIDMRLTASGQEWLLLCNGIGCGGVPILQNMSPPAMVPATVTQLPATVQSLLLPLPSATLRKAYIVLGTGDVAPFPTDPTASPFFTVTLPVQAGQFRVVVD